jgi:hypothetical protein
VIIPRVVLVVLLSTFLLNCSESPEDTMLPGVTGDSPASQSPAAASEVTIGPDEATAQTIISLRTNNAVINTGEVHWYINGNRDESSKRLRLISNELKKGDVVHAVITDGDKVYNSNEITIKNTPPVILKAKLHPSIPRVSSTLTVDLKAGDADNDNISFKYQWTLNGKFSGEQNYLAAELKREDMITVKVTPYDGEDLGRSINLRRKVFNSLPVVSESSSSFDGKIYKYQIAASDPDNDKLTYKLEQGPDGMTLDPASGIITWEVSPDDKGIHEAKVLISDNNNGNLLVPFTTRISFE